MTANLCCESTGRHAAEHGYDVTFLRDAIGAENLPAYEASIRVNYPLIANAVLDVEVFLTVLVADRTAPAEGDTVIAADQLKLGTAQEVFDGDAQRPGYVLVPRGVFARDTYIPLDAVVKVADRQVFVNIPKLVVGDMPWDEPPTAASHRDKLGSPREQVRALYGSRSPSRDQH